MAKLVKAAALLVGTLLGSAVMAQDAKVPEGYPADYSKMIEASRTEKGLLIYSNLSPANWKPILEGFKGKYPWIGVETLDISSGTIHTRWQAESASNARTADILVSAAIEHWIGHGTKGEMTEYDSPELKNLPDFAREYNSVFVMSTDPVIMTYNAKLLPENMRPTGFASLADLAQKNPGVFKGKITTYEPRNSFGQATWWTVMNKMGEPGWEILSKLGPSLRVEQTGGAMNEKIATGEYVVGVAVSGITIFPRLSKPGGDLIGVTFPDDGTPLMFRAIGVPTKAANPNSAKLLLDYVLSKEGQELLAKGGLTPYHPGVDAKSVPYYTYESIKEKVGAENVINITFNKKLLDETETFIKRWDLAVKK
jgi:iron(III) transport system substrate-binding protein